jgi:hypothetical protein
LPSTQFWISARMICFGRPPSIASTEFVTASIWRRSPSDQTFCLPIWMP